jgi:hypothetical protein
MQAFCISVCDRVTYPLGRWGSGTQSNSSVFTQGKPEQSCKYDPTLLLDTELFQGLHHESNTLVDAYSLGTSTARPAK